MKKILLLLAILFACSCSSNNKEITELDKILAEDNYIIVDVRSLEEYNELHIVGAINIPYTEIDESISLEKDKTILVYCQSGNRSKIAKTLLEQLGYTVYDMGGINSINMPKE